MDFMSQYNKAIVAFLGAMVTLAATFGLTVDWATPEVIQAAGGIVTAILVWAIPNKVA